MICGRLERGGFSHMEMHIDGSVVHSVSSARCDFDLFTVSCLHSLLLSFCWPCSIAVLRMSLSWFSRVPVPQIGHGICRIDCLRRYRPIPVLRLAVSQPSSFSDLAALI